MQLSVRDVAGILNVAEKTIYRWLKRGEIPAYRVGEQYRFSRLEILEWATSRKMDVAQDIVLAGEAQEGTPPSLVEALENGGIFYRVGGEDRQAALKSVVACLRLPPGTDRDYCFRILLAREELASTGIGDGIAIPHMRSPVILPIEAPQVTLCFLGQPVAFGALDGKPVFALFTLICPTIKSHLHLLSRLAFALRDPGFRTAIADGASRQDIMNEAARAEARLCDRVVP